MQLADPSTSIGWSLPDVSVEFDGSNLLIVWYKVLFTVLYCGSGAAQDAAFVWCSYDCL